MPCGRISLCFFSFFCLDDFSGGTFSLCFVFRSPFDPSLPMMVAVFSLNFGASLSAFSFRNPLSVCSLLCLFSRNVSPFFLGLPEPLLFPLLCDGFKEDCGLACGGGEMRTGSIREVVDGFRVSVVILQRMVLCRN